MRYLTKGEFLVLLGEDADRFTAFMMNPELYGVTEPYLTKLRVALKKFEWTNQVDLDLPEINELVGLLRSFGILTDANVAAINAITDRGDGDMYVVTIKAQDEITAENVAGAYFDGNAWCVVADIVNKTKGVTYTENFYFSEQPSLEAVTEAIDSKIHQLKAM